MKDNRIIKDGKRLKFTCGNRKFRTDINKGYPHGEGKAKGSVIDRAL